MNNDAAKNAAKYAVVARDADLSVDTAPERVTVQCRTAMQAEFFSRLAVRHGAKEIVVTARGTRLAVKF